MKIRSAKLQSDEKSRVDSARIVIDNVTRIVPFDSANTDYAEFKKAVMEGAELQDADGNVMTAEAAQEFVKGLP